MTDDAPLWQQNSAAWLAERSVEINELRAEVERLHGVIAAMDDDADLVLDDQAEAVEAESQAGDRAVRAARRDALTEAAEAIEAADPQSDEASRAFRAEDKAYIAGWIDATEQAARIVTELRDRETP